MRSNNLQTLFVGLPWLNIAVLLVHGQSESEPTCFQAGECTESLSIGEWSVDETQECLEECQDDADCLYFTFFEDNNDCQGFANCEVFQDSCTNCYSGESSCQDLQCWVPGLCQGTQLGDMTAQSSNDCYDLCREDSDCLWFTYDSSDGSCFLPEDCQELDTDCETCLSGQRQCSRNKGYTKLFVLAGYNGDDADNGGSVRSVEVIDLESLTNTCNPVNDYPIADFGMTAGFVDGLIKSCGSAYDNNDCYDYNPATNTWITSTSMLHSRHDPRSSFIDGVWLVSGDKYYSGDVGDSTEIWTGGKFEEGPTLPIEMFYHCQLTVNSTHVFFADTYTTGFAYLFDWYSQTWTELPPTIVDWEYMSCGLINNPENGLEVVIVQDGISEIFNFNNLSWRDGPTINDSFNRASAAQLTDTFVIVGGYHGYNNDQLDTIYKFDNNKYDWILMSQKLQEPREFAGVVAVPDEFVTCS